LQALKMMEVYAMVSVLWQFCGGLNLFAAFREYKHCINNQLLTLCVIDLNLMRVQVIKPSLN
jgi:hypothetical protein